MPIQRKSSDCSVAAAGDSQPEDIAGCQPVWVKISIMLCQIVNQPNTVIRQVLQWLTAQCQRILKSAVGIG